MCRYLQTKTLCGIVWCEFADDQCRICQLTSNCPADLLAVPSSVDGWDATKPDASVASTLDVAGPSDRRTPREGTADPAAKAGAAGSRTPPLAGAPSGGDLGGPGADGQWPAAVAAAAARRLCSAELWWL